MYKVASDKAQRRSSLLTMQTVNAAWEDVLTKEQERQNIVAVLKSVEAKMLTFSKGSPQRADLAAQKADLQRQITEIRPKRKGPRGIEGCFVSVCRDRLPLGQFRILMNAAGDMARRLFTEANPDINTFGDGK